MKKIKYLTIILCMIMLVFLIPSISNGAEIGVTKNAYSNNGSMKFTFTGLTLDTTHEYEFGLTKASATEVGTWHPITAGDITEATATVDLQATVRDILAVINETDTGYITIKDKTANTTVLPAHSVDLKTPYLLVTNYMVLSNGKSFNTTSNNITVALRNHSTSQPQYQYEKITDESIINEYKEIKSKNGDYLKLQSKLKTTLPTGSWTNWSYWNGPSGNGFGYPQKDITAPDTGLYYMWLYFAPKANNLKPIYGFILVDNLAPDIALEGISLPETQNVELGKTLTLTPTFNPTGATNKIVTWSSSDTTVATVDNNGKITPLKKGATIITVTSQDGAKTATCTVTVTEASSGNNGGTGAGTSGNGSGTGGTKGDGTTVNGKLPKTGESITIILCVVVLAGLGTMLYFKNKQYKDIK